MLKGKGDLNRRRELEAVIYPKMGKTTPQDKDSVLSIAVIILVFALLLTFVGYVPVEGSSMMPTIKSKGDAAIVVRGLVRPDYGDIVIVNNDAHELEGAVNELLIKRVVAKEGDRVSLLPLYEGGKVVLKVNGVVVDEPYIEDMSSKTMTRYQEEIVVPKGHYYVLGDNREASADSRIFGTVSEKNVQSVVVILMGRGGFRFV